MTNPAQPPLTAFASDGPRRWVEIPAMTCRQLEASRGMILAAADETATDRAIVLGAGTCREIPLKELAGRFGALTLNDSDPALLDQALAEAGIGPDTAARLEIRIADLTGVADDFLRRVAECLAAADDPEDAAGRIAAVADATRPGVFSTGRRHDLVVASCVLCQLHVHACNRAIDLFAARFPDRVQGFRESPRWVQAMYALARRMEKSFIDALHGLVEPDGRIYLSESVQGCYLHPAPGGRWKTDGMYRMTRTTELADDVDDRFRVVDRGKWVWVIAPSAENGEVGRLYKVQGLVLAPAS